MKFEYGSLNGLSLSQSSRAHNTCKNGGQVRGNDYFTLQNPQILHYFIKYYVRFIYNVLLDTVRVEFFTVTEFYLQRVKLCYKK